MRSVRFTKENFVDLTLPPILPSFTDIKKEHNLFFPYNPHGCDVPIYSDFKYCEFCRCPLVYCCDTVFGPSCYKDVERLVCKNGFDEFDEDCKIKHFLNARIQTW